MNVRDLDKLLVPLADRIRTMLSFGVVKLTDPSPMAQTVQVVAFDGEPLDHVHHWEPYGFTSRPLAGAEALLGNVGGSRGHVTAITIGDRRFRVKNLAKGEIAISDDLGNVIHWKRDRILVDSGDLVEVRAPVCRIDAATTEITGDLQVGGDINATGQIDSTTGVSVGGLEMGAHTHTDSTGGSTGGPQ